MQAYLLLGPTSIDGGGGSQQNFSIGPWTWTRSWSCSPRRSRWASVIASATIDSRQNHYAVLGVSPDASSSDIKKAYRLLALKYHPDVSKDSRADEVFKSIRLAYDILSNDAARNEYDQALRYQEDTRRPWGGNKDYYPGFDDGIRIYRWSNVKRKTQREKYWQRYNVGQETNFYNETDLSEKEATDEERGSFGEVLRSAFLSLFLMQTIGARLSLTFSSLMALLDEKLDAGYKLGYLIAWILGGSGGILLTLSLLFASWVCGKSSSSAVALIVVAMWVGSNLARYAPLPQGALLTLLYMSIKLQVDLN